MDEARAPHPETPRRRRLKLMVMSLFIGGAALFLVFYLVLGAIKMSQGDPLGYQQRDHRTGEIRD